MQASKFSRLMTLVTVFVVAFLASACSPSAVSPTAAATTVPSSSADSAGDPEAAAKAFFDALFTGADITPFVCTSGGADAVAAQAGYKQMATAYSSLKVDTSGVVFTASDVTADKATVTVSGSISVDTQGVKTDVPMTVFPPISVTNEGATWKVCS